MKFKLLTLAALLSLSTGLQAQNKAPQFVSKNGIGLVMPDSLFSINFRFRIQSRVGLAAHDEDLGNIT